MNVTVMRCVPAVTVMGMSVNRFMISARPGAPPRSIVARSSAPPMSPRNTSLRSTSTTSVCRVSIERGYRPDAEVGKREAILAVGRERVREPQAAAGAERHAVDVGLLVAGRRREVRGGDLGHGLADREMRDRARHVDVLLDERRRHAERGRDVREAVDLDLGRQVLGGIDLDAEQVLHGAGVLGSAEPLSGHVADFVLAARRHRSSARARRSSRRFSPARAAGCPAAA